MNTGEPNSLLIIATKAGRLPSVSVRTDTVEVAWEEMETVSKTNRFLRTLLSDGLELFLSSDQRVDSKNSLCVLPPVAGTPLPRRLVREAGAASL